MERALFLSEVAYGKNEVPVGAVILDENGILLAENHNRTIEQKDSSAHAEILVIREAAAQIKDWRLVGCTLFCTVEPCLMCLGAIINSRITRLVYAAKDNRQGALSGWIHIPLEQHPIHHLQAIQTTNEEHIKIASDIMKQFFKSKR